MKIKKIHNHSWLIIPLIVSLWIFIPDGIMGHPMSDMADHFWGNRWFATKLWGFSPPIHTALTHFPEGGYIWHIDPIGGIVQLTTLSLAPHHAWHFGLFVQLSFGGVLMSRLANEHLNDNLLATGLGLALVFSAHMLGLLHSGLSEYLGVGWLIGVLWALHKKNFKLLGVVLGVCFWQAAPYGLLGALVCIAKLFKSPKLLTMVGVIAVGVSAPAIYAIHWTSGHPEAAFPLSQAAGWSPQSLPSIDLMGWVVPGNWLHPDTPKMGNPGILQAHGLSLTLVFTVVYGWFKNKPARQWLMSHWGIVILMLGPKLSIYRWLPLDGSLFLPMALLYLPGLPTGGLHHPYHAAAVVLPVLLIGAGFTLKSFPKPLQLGILILFIIESAISPAGLFPERTPVPSPFGTEGPRLDWPPDRHTPNRHYLLSHVYHQQATYTGVSQWLGPCLLNSIEVNEALELLDDPSYRSLNRDQHTPIALPRQPTGSLSQCGFENLVVHKSFLGEEELRKTKKYFSLKLGLPNMENDEFIHYNSLNETVK